MATEPMGMGVGILVAGLPWTLVHGAGWVLAVPASGSRRLCSTEAFLFTNIRTLVLCWSLITFVRANPLSGPLLLSSLKGDMKASCLEGHLALLHSPPWLLRGSRSHSPVDGT